MMRFFVLALLLLSPAMLHAQSRNLDIYWIDVEGGAATLIVSPSGESMLIDTGFEVDDRDAKRIHAAAQQAGLKKIDHLVISHYHADHVGGLAALSKMMPIDRFYGRGDEIEPVNQKWLDSYRTAAAGKRTIVKPGDQIPIKGLQALVVASDGKLLAKPLGGGGPNPLCAGTEQKAPAGPENQNMVGTLLTFGRFKLLALIDLDWEKEMELVCPVNKLGTVTVYQTGRHGAFDGAGSPALLDAIRPQVAVVNNGPRKGLGQVDTTVRSTTPAGTKTTPYEKNGYARLAKIPGIEGIWQGHLSLLDKAPNHNTSEDMIANLEDTADCKGHWIKASVEPTGRFTIVNGRNGFSKTYTARRGPLSDARSLRPGALTQ
ncbi:MAG: MBL fold metallo-hydrolase [Acidobacteria bacterium]|nr:MAG: MBL fold metallo-hydrolase [Acidobacteriota bacterium]